MKHNKWADWNTGCTSVCKDRTGGQRMELQINSQEPGETGRSLKDVTGYKAARAHTVILNYHCILFLSDPIITQPQNNYIQWMRSKTQMKCNRRSETLSSCLSGLENGSLQNTFKPSAAPSTHNRRTESEECILKLRRFVSPTPREALISHNAAVWFSSCDSMPVFPLSSGARVYDEIA